MSNRRKILFALAAILLGSLLLVYVLRVSLLKAAADWLVVEDQLAAGDLVFLLNGEEETRPFHAAELVKDGWAPRVVLAQVKDSPTVELGLYPNPTAVSVGMLEQAGVPAEDIIVLSDDLVSSTRDEAVALKQYLNQNKVERVILVTSALHTRRSEWIIQKTLAGADVELVVSPAVHYDFSVDNWWQSERGLVYLTNEYIKLLYYLFSY